jgi:hypothetical protein
MLKPVYFFKTRLTNVICAVVLLLFSLVGDCASVTSRDPAGSERLPRTLFKLFAKHSTAAADVFAFLFSSSLYISHPNTRKQL